MNVSPNAPQVIPVSAQEGKELLTAALAKDNQKLQGEMALKLLEPVQEGPAPSANPAVGKTINVRV